MKKKWWLFLLIGVIAVLGIGVLTMNRSAQARLDAAIAHAHSIGMPIEPDDLKKRHVAPAENAAEEYRKAIASLSLISKGDRNLIEKYPAAMALKDPKLAFQRFAIMGPVDHARISEALKAWKPAFSHIAKAVEKPHLDWERPWEQGASLVFSEYAPLKDTLKVLMQDAQRAAWSHDTATIRMRITQGRKIAAHMMEEPTLIAGLVGIADHSIVNMQAMQLAYEFRDDPAIVAAIREELSKPPVLPNLRVSLSGEAVFARAGIELVAKNPSLISPSGASSGEDEFSRDFNSDARYLKLPWVRLETEAILIERYAEAYGKLPADTGAWEESAQVMRDLDASFRRQGTRSERLAGALAPIFAGIGDSLANIHLYQRQAIIVTHLLDIHRTTGKWPEKLPDLPGINVDPYTKAPFIYRTTKDGFVLYSVGPDLKDDGGKLDEQGRKDKSVGILDGKLVRR